MLITDLLFEGRREEASLRADLSAHLTGAGRIQLVIDGDVTQVQQTPAHFMLRLVVLLTHPAQLVNS